MKTVNGIYYDIFDSDYIYEYENYKFYFTSEVYKRKFIERLNDEIISESLKFKEKFKFDVDMKDLIIIRLYQKIEKRGFRIEKELEDNSKLIYENPPKFKLLML